MRDTKLGLPPGKRAVIATAIPARNYLVIVVPCVVLVLNAGQDEQHRQDEDEDHDHLAPLGPNSA